MQRYLSAEIRGVLLQHHQRACAPKRICLLLVPKPNGGVPGRGIAKGFGFGVEHEHDHGDELFGPVGQIHLIVKLLEGLGGIAEFQQQNAHQKLRQKRRDGRLHAVPRNIAEHGCRSGGRDLVDVVEVARHEPRSCLIDAPRLKAGELLQLLGRKPLGPSLGCRLGLRESFFGFHLNGEALAQQQGVLERLSAPPQSRHQSRHSHQQIQHRPVEIVRESDRSRSHSQEEIQHSGVGFFEEVGAGYLLGVLLAAGGGFAVVFLDHISLHSAHVVEAVAGRASPHGSGNDARYRNDG